MQVQGFCFDGQSSQRHTAQLGTTADGVQLQFDGHTLHYRSAQMQLGPRLGNTPRQISFDDGASFVTDQHEQLEQLIRQLPGSTRNSQHQGSGWLHRIESRWHWVLAACVVLVLALYLGLTRGAPLAARAIVTFIPATVEQHIGAQTLQLLDQALLEPSRLSAERQQQLQQHFAPMLQAYPDLSLRVHFRHAPSIGANAFALPGGDMVFIDDLVRLAQHDNELSAVLAHEIGHVEHRHGMRRVVQNGLLYWALFAITGDISAASETLAAAPALLMNMAYSRDMEDEADRHALHRLQQQGLSPRHFADIMRRLDSDTSRRPDTDKNRLLRMLSSHPDTRERIRPFELQD